MDLDQKFLDCRSNSEIEDIKGIDGNEKVAVDEPIIFTLLLQFAGVPPPTTVINTTRTILYIRWVHFVILWTTTLFFMISPWIKMRSDTYVQSWWDVASNLSDLWSIGMAVCYTRRREWMTGLYRTNIKIRESVDFFSKWIYIADVGGLLVAVAVWTTYSVLHVAILRFHPAITLPSLVIVRWPQLLTCGNLLFLHCVISTAIVRHHSERLGKMAKAASNKVYGTLFDVYVTTDSRLEELAKLLEIPLGLTAGLQVGFLSLVFLSYVKTVQSENYRWALYALYLIRGLIAMLNIFVPLVVLSSAQTEFDIFSRSILSNKSAPFEELSRIRFLMIGRPLVFKLFGIRINRYTIGSAFITSIAVNMPAVLSAVFGIRLD